jgi:nucleotide-binding universal stress UspA family protein
LLFETGMRIICATDFSPAARAASDTAVQMAAKLGDNVLLIHVIDPVSMAGLEGAPAMSSWETVLRGAAERQLDAEAEKLRATGVVVRTRVLAGRPAEKTREAVAEDQTRLVVVGSHGRKGAAHLFLGSVAEEIARESPCPVLVTRGLPYPADGLAGQRRLQLLVMAEGTAGAEAALGWVKSLRSVLPCDITFLQPYSENAEQQRFGLAEASGTAAAPQALRALLERELRRWVGSLPGEGEVRFRLRPSRGNPIDELAFDSELLQPDLVVVGVSSRRTPAASGTLTAATAVQALKIPVVCVPETLRPKIDGRIPMIRTVLVGTDLSDFSNQVVPAAYALLLGTGGHMEVCHVIERAPHTPPATGETPSSALDPREKSGLEATLSKLTPPEAAGLGISTRLAVIEAPVATDGLLQEAERIGADVIVVASHGRTGIKRALLGSVSAALTERSSRPVLILHPPSR